jgi:hypothetical protein
VPLPLAAIATTAFSVGSAALAKRQEALRANVSKTLGALTRVGAGVVSGGGFIPQAVQAGVSGVYDMATQPRVSTATRVAAGPTGETVRLARQFAGQGPVTYDIATGQVYGRRRYRRMNVCNVKALRRAGRRVEGFVKLAKSLISMPGARAKHPIKKRRRR